MTDDKVWAENYHLVDGKNVNTVQWATSYNVYIVILNLIESGLCQSALSSVTLLLDDVCYKVFLIY